MNDPEGTRIPDLRFRNQQQPPASSAPQRRDGAGEGESGPDLSRDRHNGKGSPSFPADDRHRAARQLEAVRDLMTVRWPGVWFRLDAISWECEGSEASASARVRDLRKEGWSVERRRVEGTRLREYRVNGRAPLEPAKRRPRDSELDALRARIERVEAELAALSTSTTRPGLAGAATGGGVPLVGPARHPRCPAVAAESRALSSEEGL